MGNTNESIWIYDLNFAALRTPGAAAPPQGATPSTYNHRGVRAYSLGITRPCALVAFRRLLRNPRQVAVARQPPARRGQCSSRVYCVVYTYIASSAGWPEWADISLFLINRGFVSSYFSQPQEFYESCDNTLIETACSIREPPWK